LGRRECFGQERLRWTHTEALARDITVRHLLTHTAGLSHGLLDPGTMIYEAYAASGLRRQDCSTTMIAERLPLLPLLFQPGEGWEYSMAPDVLARLVEIITGQRYIEALQQRLFGPLGMVDNRIRPAARAGGRVSRPCMAAISPTPTSPDSRRLDELPWPGAFLTPVPREAGASGLFTTQADMLALLSHLFPGRSGPLADATLAEMFRDQLPAQLCVQFLQSGPIPAFGFLPCRRGNAASFPNAAQHAGWRTAVGEGWPAHTGRSRPPPAKRWCS
jgi:CubicO group peptidase (beta-lactamase class C family)